MGSKIMAQNPKFDKLNLTKGNCGHLAECHNLPADSARELFKPSKDTENLVVSIYKKVEISGFLFMTS